MALSDVLKKYGDSTATEGIMFPSAGVQSVTTEQQVYDSTTDGIMTVTGQQYSLPTYTGPTATVQYGEEDAGYPRMLRQIEQGELPQFKQEDFPKQGEGVMTPSTPVTQPVETTPVQSEQPAVDPCPPGYKLIGGVCQPIQQDRGNNRPTFTGPKISKEGIIDGYESALNRAEGSMLAGGLNSNRMMQLEKQFGAEVVAEIGKVNQKYNNRGVQIKTLDEDDPEIKRLQAVYGQDRVDQDYIYSNNKYYRIIATSPTLSELAGDAGRAIGEILETVTTEGAGFIKAGVEAAKKLGEYLTKEEDNTPDITVNREGPTGPPNTQIDSSVSTESKQDIPDEVSQSFGDIDNISNLVRDFGQFQNSIISNQERLQTLQNELQNLESQQFTPSMLNETRENIGKQEGIKSLIQETKGNINKDLTNSKKEERKVQNELNNSKESNINIKGSNFTVHKNSDNKIVGYSKAGSNIVNMAGMPPVGPGQRIKTPPSKKTTKGTQGSTSGPPNRFNKGR